MVKLDLYVYESFTVQGTVMKGFDSDGILQ